MTFITRPARGRLEGLVDRFWLVEESGCPSVPETICPDGRTEIVLHLGDPMLERGGAKDRRQPQHLLVGQMAAPVTIVPTGRVAMVGARLAPGALHRLLPIPQDRISGQIIALDSVWERWTRETVDAVGSAATPATRLAALERAFEAIAPESSTATATRWLDLAIRRLQASGGMASIARLADDLGFSRRQFERRFREHVGLPPRLFGRIVRFQRAFQSLGVESGASIAARCGYADQAHLVHEIKRFAGQTPTLLAEASGLTAFFRD